ncbi:MAG: homoserine O-acetyltransferase, partial [Euryarchaeota archaeon]|nr:homoserine O-acetyltransferase [Euryarchaeota archaeon]
MYEVAATLRTKYHTFDALDLDCGRTLAPTTVAYEAYGKLNPAHDNVILLLHALSGSAHAGFTNDKGEQGWWYDFIGPGKALDTNKYFIICS